MNDLYILYEITIFYVYLCLAKQCKMQILIRRYLNTTGTQNHEGFMRSYDIINRPQRIMPFFSNSSRRRATNISRYGIKPWGLGSGVSHSYLTQGVEICAPKNPPKKIKSDHFGGSGGVQRWAPMVCFFDARDK